MVSENGLQHHRQFLIAYITCEQGISKYTWCLTATETVRLIRDGEKGGRGCGGGGEREIIHLSLHCHHQNDSCFKTGSDESHFNCFSRK